MSAPDEPDSPSRPDRQPTRDLLLAQALDACIDAEREVPGLSEELIDGQPAWVHAELSKLVGLAGSLDAATSNAFMSEDFRFKARNRLMQRIGGTVAIEPPSHSPRITRLVAVSSGTPRHSGTSRRKLPRLWRGVAGLVAASVGLVATLTASASALPGEPLYTVKQAHEDLEVRLADGEEARMQILLRLADMRLAETQRLLQLGRTGQVAETTARYDNVVELATMTYVVGADDPRRQPPIPSALETRLGQQQDELETLLQSAPEGARADLREALVATERGRVAVARPPGDSHIPASLPTPAPLSGSSSQPGSSNQAVPTPPPPTPIVAPTPVSVAAQPPSAPPGTPTLGGAPNDSADAGALAGAGALEQSDIQADADLVEDTYAAPTSVPVRAPVKSARGASGDGASQHIEIAPTPPAAAVIGVSDTDTNTDQKDPHAAGGLGIAFRGGVSEVSVHGGDIADQLRRVLPQPNITPTQTLPHIETGTSSGRGTDDRTRTAAAATPAIVPTTVAAAVAPATPEGRGSIARPAAAENRRTSGNVGGTTTMTTTAAAAVIKPPSTAAAASPASTVSAHQGDSAATTRAASTSAVVKPSSNPLSGAANTSSVRSGGAFRGPNTPARTQAAGVGRR